PARLAPCATPGAPETSSSASWAPEAPGSTQEGREDATAVGDPAEDSSLRLDHPQRHLVELRKVGATTVARNQATIASSVGLAHRGVHANLGRDATDDQALDPRAPQNHFQVRRVERALTRLVHDGLARRRIELRHDVVAGLTADQNAPHRARLADAQARGAALQLRLRHV